jgi:phosphatidylserine/phosphatidylglycerophosphate/cardiolipin synthase-like enzyme
MKLPRLILTIGLLSLTVGLTACPKRVDQSAQAVGLQGLEPLPQDEAIQVYTNHNPANQFTDVYLKRERFGDDLEQVILDEIGDAKSSIVIAVQEFRLPRVAQALREKQQTGVQVRVIIENTYREPYSAASDAELAKMPDRARDRILDGRRLIDQNNDGQLSQAEINDRDALVILEQSGIKLIDDTADGSKGSNLMHHKFVVIDNQTVIATSANFTTSDMVGDFDKTASRGNPNTLLRIQSAELAALFLEEFNLMWGNGTGGSRFGVKKPARSIKTITVGNTPISIHFSPTTKSHPWEVSSNGLIARTFSQAKQSIDMALFVFSDQQLVDRLEPLSQSGVKVRALIDSGFVYRSYSEALDMLGVQAHCRVETNNRPWARPITDVGTPKLPPGDLLHHKFGVIDQRIVIMGSHNWTEAANNGNDEFVMVIDNPTVAAHFQREFDRLTERVYWGLPPAVKKKLDRAC